MRVSESFSFSFTGVPYHVRWLACIRLRAFGVRCSACVRQQCHRRTRRHITSIRLSSPPDCSVGSYGDPRIRHDDGRARGIRTAVFVVEKDYRPEFDEWDEPGRATHLLAFGNGRAVATCRLYPDLDHADQPGRWVIGRLAVVADERGHGIGKTVLAEAERLIRKAGGHVAAVHSEDKNFAMYEHLGYRITSELFDNGTHGWLVKALN